ncbi:MAG: cell envelope integrity protein TolA [Pseudomonadota bacterium]
MAQAMAVSLRPDPYRGPLLVSLGLHGVLILLLSMNLSLCSREIVLPPVPEHVRAVVVERTSAAPAPVVEVAEPVALPEPLPEPEPPKPVPKKPDVKKPEPKKPEPKKPEPVKKAVPKPEPKPVAKPAEKPVEKPKGKPAPPPPDFSEMLAQEQRTLNADDSARRAASEQAAREAAARASAEQKVVEEYTLLMQREIGRRWNRPPGARAGMVTVLRISLLPGGELQGVEVVKSSGDIAFDRSAENAVRLAGRLPVPTDPGLFNRSFRRFTFTFDPRDLGP